MRLLFLLFLILIAGMASASEHKRLALSLDDVPRHAGGFFSFDERSIKLIAALDRAGVEQAGFFVTTGNLEEDFGRGGEDRIRAYVAAGRVIGNHSATHPCEPMSTPSAGTDTMKAIVYGCYGSSEVLVKIHAAAVNPLDWHFMRGSPYIMRLASGLGAPHDTRLGVIVSRWPVSDLNRCRRPRILA